MKKNDFIEELKKSRKPFPILSFPAAGITGYSVYDFTHDSQAQAEGVIAVSKELDLFASVTMMDLSVEAECFGCGLTGGQYDVPAVKGILIETYEDAEKLAVPEVGSCRSGIFIDAVRKSKKLLDGRPLFAGIIGPFSLAGRLCGVENILVNVLEDPEMCEIILEKVTDFLVSYALELKKAGADGLIIAEPMAGLLSPRLEKEFSAGYVRKLIGAVKDEEFFTVYHNCGNNIPYILPSMLSLGADAFHLGDAIDICDVLKKIPEDIIVMGNISPVEQFVNGTPESMKTAVHELLSGTAGYSNFVLSSGCDISYNADWNNIRAFFEASDDFYRK